MIFSAKIHLKHDDVYHLQGRFFSDLMLMGFFYPVIFRIRSPQYHMGSLCKSGCQKKVKSLQFSAENFCKSPAGAKKNGAKLLNIELDQKAGNCRQKIDP